MLIKHQLGNNHHYTWNGEKIPSVTDILGKTRPKEVETKINNWRTKFDKQTAAAITNNTEPPQCPSVRGTAAHEAVYQYFCGQEVDNPYVVNAVPLLEQLRDSWLYCEEELANVSKDYHYAGTCDLVARYGVYNYVFDWISSDKYKKKEWIEDKLIQAAAYALAINSNPEMGIKIDRVAAVVLRPDRHQIFTANLSEYDWQWQARYCKYVAGF